MLDVSFPSWNGGEFLSSLLSPLSYSGNTINKGAPLVLFIKRVTSRPIYLLDICCSMSRQHIPPLGTFCFFDGFTFSGKMNVSDKQTYYQEVNKYPE